MKRYYIVLLSALFIASFGACGAPAAPASSAGASSLAVSSELPASQNAPAEAKTTDEALPMEKIEIADAAMFRGVVEDFAVSDDGKTVLLMRRAIGTDFISTLKVKLAEDTQYSFDGTKIANGAFLEVFYGAEEGKTPEIVDAVAINDLISEEAVNYNGKLVSVSKDGEEGQLLLDPLDASGMQYAFNFGPETQFYLDFDALKPGDLLNVYHSMISTRSIPPQGPAFEVRPYTAPAENELPLPVASAPLDSTAKPLN